MIITRYRHIFMCLTFTFLGACSLMGGSKEDLSHLQLKTLSVNDLSNRKVALTPDQKISALEYAQRTSLKKNSTTKVTFTPEFTTKYLTRPPVYTETYEENSDRLVINRELVLHTKKPCDKALADDFMALCFRPKEGGKWNDEVKADVKSIKTAIKKSIESGDQVDPKWKKAIKLSDEKFLAYLLNGQSNERVIRSRSYAPYNLYKLDKKKILDFADLSKPLYTKEEVKRAETLQLARFQRHNGGISPEVLDRLRDVDISVLNSLAMDFEGKRNFEKKVVFGETYVVNHPDHFEIQFARATRFTDRYYFRFTYNLNLALGLRFPFVLQGESEITHVANGAGHNVPKPADELCREVATSTHADKCATVAQVKVKARPATITESNKTFYEQAGVPSDEVLNGNEFVFGFGAGCSLKISIPGPDPRTVRCPGDLAWVVKREKNFRPQLGSGSSTLLNVPINGREAGLSIEGFFGWAAINPGIAVNGRNGKIHADITATNGRRNPHPNAEIRPSSLQLDGTEKSYRVEENVTNGEVEPWGSKISLNEYKVNIDLAPSFTLSMGIDVGVYDWDGTTDPYVIDALAIDFGRYGFDPHEGVLANQTVYSGNRDKFAEAIDNSLFLVTDNGAGADGDILLCRGEGGGNRFKASNQITLPEDLAIGDYVRITNFTSDTGLITNGQTDYLGPAGHIVGKATTRSCSGRATVKDECGNTCTVYTSNNRDACDIEFGTLFKFSGDVEWQVNSEGEWDGMNNSNCVIRNANIEPIALQ